jgi:hypothetical protein
MSSDAARGSGALEGAGAGAGAGAGTGAGAGAGAFAGAGATLPAPPSAAGAAGTFPLAPVEALASAALAALRAEGYALLPRFVQAPLVGRALRAVNSELARSLSDEEIEAMRLNARSFGSSALLNGAAMKALLHESGIFALAQRLYGVAGLAPLPSYWCQVALRFPLPDGEVAPAELLPWHIDNVTPEGCRPFGLLAGIFLTDCEDENSGNLEVFPGGHEQLGAHFRARGTRAVFRNANGRIEAPTAVDLPLAAPRQLRVRAGDVVLAHPLLPHRVAPNLAPNVRVAVYFRFYHSLLPYEHPAECRLRTLALQHIWALGWEGLLDQDLCPGPAPAPASAASAEAAMAAGRAAVAAWAEGDAPLHCIDPVALCDCGALAAPALHFTAAGLLAPSEEGAGWREAEGGSGEEPAPTFWLRASMCTGSFDFWRAARGFIAEQIPAMCAAAAGRGARVLDIGCADGLLLRCLREWSGLDFAPRGIDIHWSVSLAPRLFSPEARARFARVSLRDFLRLSAAERCALFGEEESGPDNFAFIYFNVWDNVTIDAAFLSQASRLREMLALGGRLALGLYGNAAANAPRAAALLEGLGGGARLVANSEGVPHVLVVVEKDG